MTTDSDNLPKNAVGAFSGIATNEPQQEQSSDPYSAELGSVRAEIAKVRQSISHITANINAMYDEIGKHTADLQAQIREVNREIDELVHEAQADARAARTDYVPDDLDEEFAEFDSEYTRGPEDYERESYDARSDLGVTSEKEDPRLVKLFRMIAAKTHPDKTDDPELHSLFVSAKEFRNRGDMDGLRGIYDYLTGKTKSPIASLAQALRDAYAELHSVELTLRLLRPSHDNWLAGQYKRDRTMVLKQARMGMLEKLTSLRASLKMYREILNKKLPPPQFGLNIEGI